MAGVRAREDMATRVAVNRSSNVSNREVTEEEEKGSGVRGGTRRGRSSVAVSSSRLAAVSAVRWTAEQATNPPL